MDITTQIKSLAQQIYNFISAQNYLMVIIQTKTDIVSDNYCYVVIVDKSSNNLKY